MHGTIGLHTYIQFFYLDVFQDDLGIIADRLHKEHLIMGRCDIIAEWSTKSAV